MLFLIVIVAIIVILAMGYISISNSIRVLELKVAEALSGIDVALTKRYDTLTKMVSVAKSFKAFEAETLENVIKLRSGMTMSERNEANKKMDELASKINVIAENYPTLRTADTFIELQRAIVDVEEHLQAARRMYNANVTAYNAKTVVFPSSMVANMIGATRKEYFVAEESKRSDVKMDL